jgi:hypothetical protein
VVMLAVLGASVAVLALHGFQVVHVTLRERPGEPPTRTIHGLCVMPLARDGPNAMLAQLLGPDAVGEGGARRVHSLYGNLTGFAERDGAGDARRRRPRPSSACPRSGCTGPGTRPRPSPSGRCGASQ